jgi:hypothetical protein
MSAGCDRIFGMAKTILEIHIPLVPTPGLPEDEYQFPWIFVVEDFLAEHEVPGQVEVYDDGESLGDDDYTFFLTGTDEEELIAAASRVLSLDDVPDGVFALMTDDEAETGTGRRVELSEL